MTGHGWLIYHPKRQVSRFAGLTVHHDSLAGNQDPYVWNRRFLHTACHITQMSPEVGDVNFWVSGDTFPGFSILWCDLVFVVEDKIYWQDSNRIAVGDPVVDSPEAFADHYAPMPNEHPYRRRRRFTLKADPALSFQPQNDNGSLIDLVPLFADIGLGLDWLRIGLRAGWQSRPLRLPDGVASVVYKRLRDVAPVRMPGEQLEDIRRSDVWELATSVS
jgi:hypothetical protein